MTTDTTTTPGPDRPDRAPSAHPVEDGLTVVVPAYNEGIWVARAVTAVRRSAEEACWDVEVLVVDDGSRETESIRVLADLEASGQVRLLRQGNAGRYAARAAGVGQVRTPYVLLLDARVEVDRAALPRIRRALHDEGIDVWNFDVTPGSRTVGALFWTGITKVWWRDYFQHPRRVSFGPDAFARYPKGTGAFFAPAALLREAIGEFQSLVGDDALASDDTRLLLDLAGRRPITLSPEVTCRHHVKAGVRAWCHQCYYRGTTFVDGYLGETRRAAPTLALLSVVGVVAAVAALRLPRTAVAATVTGSAMTGAVTRWSGGTASESVSVGLLTAPFGLLFGAGVLRGLRMAIRASRQVY